MMLDDFHMRNRFRKRLMIRLKERVYYWKNAAGLSCSRKAGMREAAVDSHLQKGSMVTETLNAKERRGWAQKGEFMRASGTRSGVQGVNMLPVVSRPNGHRPRASASKCHESEQKYQELEFTL